MQQELRGCGRFPEGSPRPVPKPEFRALSLGLATLVVLVAALVSACTVRLELAAPRAVTGDLPAISAGLTGRERWLDGTRGEDRPRPREGITIAAVRPAARAAPVVEFLPAADGRSADHAPDALRGAPAPDGRPELRPVLARAAPPLPSPPKPVRLAAMSRARPAHRWPDQTLIIEGPVPAAGPPF